ncbi:Hypothetical predicted protein [Mytilus galloprovincialis]|uniref:G-protein coupled receptors family 1 profile domain-containing protein n=1 Tax=Mytilus galloprovincialis TaxID=29158 RepID=A0A8B6DEC3_MYTGA|nr:Hypothetical predicted protein [Mytilus galloprovincialis]
MCGTGPICLIYTMIISYVGILFLFFGNRKANECNYPDVIENNESKLILGIDIPVLILTLLISSLYTVVVAKIIQRHKQVHPLSRNTATRLKHCGITLGILIVVSFMAVLPRSVYSFFVLVKPESVTVSMRRITNSLYIIKPLLDPFIYILRIKTFRRYLHIDCCSRILVSDEVVVFAIPNNVANG